MIGSLRKCEKKSEMHWNPVSKTMQNPNVKYLNSNGETMILFKQIPFTFGEKEYETRVYYDDISINIVTFRNNYPANGFRHQIKVSKNIRIEDIVTNSVIDKFVEISKQDIVEKRWEKLMENKSIADNQ